ncbi:hypothetical protein [Flavobacterium sp. A45]|uniref:hypothetical protein n=1 Tax=Flavobacterium sp. A45 TaxID=1945862 RepID=UPI0009844564|nr:hypothetical protein [Flavobacterium sp. A45]OOG64708.1 hypothetical protein B0E44_15915 [Flavobacterium sp. A45]
MELQNLLKYLKIFEKDIRLNVWHFSLLTAILYLGYRQGQSKIIEVSRSRIMSISHIKTIPTYHKYFKELQTMGYIKYTPSYNPGYKSEVEILFK